MQVEPFIQETPGGAVHMITMGGKTIFQFYPPNSKSKNMCKKCNSDNVFIVSQYVEHCRTCGNWQTTF